MSNLPEGSIRELFSNATNVPVIRSVMTIFPLISWWDGKLFLYYPTWWVHPLLPKPYHTIQPVNKNHWHSLYPWRNYFSKVHCCFFYVISIPCMRLFSAICWWVSSVQEPLQNGPNAACTMILRICENIDQPNKHSRY